jgi:sugar-specific transcriptional regulator TrmB
MNHAEITSGLKILGLTDYEAKSLFALVTIGAGTPREVARESGIPYPSVYDSLRSLAQRGWVETASTRPSIFRVREPALMREKITQDINNLFAKLQQQYDNIKGESSRLALIFTIVGKTQVCDKIIELLDSTKHDAMMVIPGRIIENNFSDSPKYSALMESISRLSLRENVDFKLISDSAVPMLNGVQGNNVRRRKSVLAVDLLVDHQKALIGLPDLSACGWIDSPVISSHFGQFLDLLWKDSAPLSSARRTPPRLKKKS